MTDNLYVQAVGHLLLQRKFSRLIKIGDTQCHYVTIKKDLGKNMEWWKKTIVCEIYPKSFKDTTGTGIGDIRGIIEKLDYLKSLGIGAIWLTPIYLSPMKDNGYDIADYCSVDPMFGTMADMDELFLEAKKRDIRLVMDLVFNHTSDRHPWFEASRASKDNDKADWYIWRDPKPDGSAPNNWRAIFGGSAWEWCEARGQYYLHTFLTEQPDLNWENSKVRQALFDAARFWLDKGAGGFRLDAITYIKKPAVFEDGEPDAGDGLAGIHQATANREGILEFLHEMRENIRDGRDIFMVGEANGVEAGDLLDWVGSHGVFDMVFQFSHIGLEFRDYENWCRPQAWKPKDLKRVLTDSLRVTREDGWNPIFTENHDKPRTVNHYFPDGCDTKKSAKVGLMWLMTMRGTPFLYQGQEIGMTNVAWDKIEDYDDVLSIGQYALGLKDGFTKAEAIRAVQRYSRDSARTPMQWDSTVNAGFSTGKPWLPVNDNYKTLNVAAQERDPLSVLNYYRCLLRARQNHEVMISGSFMELLEDHEQIFAYARVYEGHKAVILMNFTEETAVFDAGILDGLVPVINSEAEVSENEAVYHAALEKADQTIRKGQLPPLAAVWYETPAAD